MHGSKRFFLKGNCLIIKGESPNQFALDVNKN